MSVLVTGSTGFVGRALVDHLLANEEHVLAAVRKESRDLPSSVQQLVIGDLSVLEETSSALKHSLFFGVDTVIHIAARVHVMNDAAYDPLEAFIKVNRDATLVLARMASESAIKRFIFLSSIKVNGEQTKLGRSFSSSDEYVPTDPYGLSKYEAEQGLLALGKETDMEIVIIRPPLVYGEGVKANFASLMRLVGKGFPLPFRAIYRNKRSLVSVYNLVDLIKVCIDHPKAANQVFLVSDDDDLSTSQMVAMMARVQGKTNLSFPVPVWCFKLAGKIFKKAAVVDRLVGSLQLDIGHTKNTLDWAPPYSVEYGFKLTAGKAST
jgi:nucleoside-diphosphate-sugar epimerase